MITEFRYSKSKLEFLDALVCKELQTIFLKKSPADRQNYPDSKSNDRKLIKSQAHELKDFSDIVGRGFLTLLFYKETPPPLTHTHTHTPNPFPCSFWCMVLWSFDRMGDHATTDVLSDLMILRSTFAKPLCLSTTRTLWCVLCNKSSVYWDLEHDEAFC